tara:strand:+ start:259 stop:687 length:429 start_codon:yes stop_codon:yes gene_type:complete
MTKHVTKPMRAIHFMVLAFLMTIGTQVSAAETVMVCDAQKDSKLFFKLRDPLIGKSQVLVRAAGQWVIWEKLDETRKSFVYDTGAKLVDTFDGKKVSAIRTTVLDFEFGTHQSITRMIRRDEDGETVSDDSGTLEFSCEIQK